MILCITPNPAIDRTIILPRLVPGHIHRAERVIVAAGGKGLNVARAIRILGGDPLCMGFVGGHAGQLLADLAQQEGFASSWTAIETETRTCTILVSPEGDATVINEPGMPVPSGAWKQLQKDVHPFISPGNIACISGSLPPDVSADDFLGLLGVFVDAGQQIWVDTSGPALQTALARPHLCVKVNGTEMGEILGREIKDFDAARHVLTTFDGYGLHACAITLGSSGALLATKDGRWRAQGPRVPVVSTVGSGDAFLGGLVRALDLGKDWPEALREAVAAGTANVLLAGGGQFRIEEFEDIRAKVEVEAW